MCGAPSDSDDFSAGATPSGDLSPEHSPERCKRRLGAHGGLLRPEERASPVPDVGHTGARRGNKGRGRSAGSNAAEAAIPSESSPPALAGKRRATDRHSRVAERPRQSLARDGELLQELAAGLAASDAAGQHSGEPRQSRRTERRAASILEWTGLSQAVAAQSGPRCVDKLPPRGSDKLPPHGSRGVVDVTNSAGEDTSPRLCHSRPLPRDTSPTCHTGQNGAPHNGHCGRTPGAETCSRKGCSKRHIVTHSPSPSLRSVSAIPESDTANGDSPTGPPSVAPVFSPEVSSKRARACSPGPALHSACSSPPASAMRPAYGLVALYGPCVEFELVDGAGAPSFCPMQSGREAARERVGSRRCSEPTAEHPCTALAGAAMGNQREVEHVRSRQLLEAGGSMANSAEQGALAAWSKGHPVSSFITPSALCVEWQAAEALPERHRQPSLPFDSSPSPADGIEIKEGLECGNDSPLQSRKRVASAVGMRAAALVSSVAVAGSANTARNSASEFVRAAAQLGGAMDFSIAVTDHSSHAAPAAQRTGSLAAVPGAPDPGLAIGNAAPRRTGSGGGLRQRVQLQECSSDSDAGACANRDIPAASGASTRDSASRACVLQRPQPSCRQVTALTAQTPGRASAPGAGAMAAIGEQAALDAASGSLGSNCHDTEAPRARCTAARTPGTAASALGVTTASPRTPEMHCLSAMSRLGPLNLTPALPLASSSDMPPISQSAHPPSAGAPRDRPQRSLESRLAPQRRRSMTALTGASPHLHSDCAGAEVPDVPAAGSAGTALAASTLSVHTPGSTLARSHGAVLAGGAGARNCASLLLIRELTRRANRPRAEARQRVCESDAELPCAVSAGTKAATVPGLEPTLRVARGRGSSLAPGSGSARLAVTDGHACVLVSHDTTPSGQLACKRDDDDEIEEIDTLLDIDEAGSLSGRRRKKKVALDRNQRKLDAFGWGRSSRPRPQ